MYLQGIGTEKLVKKVGQAMTVLSDNDGSVTRSADDAPEIDGLIYINDGQLEVGEFITVDRGFRRA